METSRNRAKVLAQFLRHAATELRRVARRVDADAAVARTTALESIEAVAAELEEQSLAGGRCSAGRGPRGRCPNPATQVAVGPRGALYRCEDHALLPQDGYRVTRLAPDPAGGTDAQA